jgi:hypothetical protein
MTIWNRIFGRGAKSDYSTSDDKRPIKLVPDGVNSWRIVYAD